ncbi:type VII secretion protein EccCb [Actinoplanes sp. NPDC049265]|uniref:type VII secretion protein EccCb n=1 Tax=Actinoplanes sp. NPDC049265 TaxID=3363902 RepID=UPI003717616B
MTRLAFHRPARFFPPQLPNEPVVLPTPPEAPKDNPSNNAWTLVMPLLSSVGMAAYMVTFGRPALIIIGVLFFATSTGAVIAMRMSQKSTAGKTTRQQRARYRAHLKISRDSARMVATSQRTVAALANPEPARLWSIATTRKRVWERRQDDPDFLRVRLGCGAVQLATPIQLDDRLDPLTDYDWESLEAANQLIERMGRVDRQPMVIDAGRGGVISLVGGKARIEPLTRALLCQIAVLHAPDDVTIAVQSAEVEDWHWAKWLPHTFEPKVRGEAGTVSLIAPDPELLGPFLARELVSRAEHQSRSRAHTTDPAAARLRRLVVVFTGFEPVSEWGRSDLMRALINAAGPGSGITLIFAGGQDADEPSRVDLRIRVDHRGELIHEGDPSLVTAPALGCTPDAVTPEFAELIARALTPLRLSDEREQLLARVTSLTEMILGPDPANADVTGRWVTPGDPRLLRTPIGTNGDGEVVVLDVKESAQGGSGPHGLIVGATGSGKSELLRTLVTGLALTHSPELLSFVLIDFKGGAAFAPLSGLPHVAGLITNLVDDTAMIDRVLAALMGEQQRRQKALRDAGNVDTIREYQVRRAAGATNERGEPLEPLPYLMIIVDEFGELLSGRPDFAELFTQIGRVGRSLGMHLLMATQRLEEGKLRGLDSHLSYRICLRTFSASESRSVIGTTDAYKLPPIPGSAYLKVDESIYQRLRVAHVSARHISPAERDAAAGRIDSSVVAFDVRTASEQVEREPDEAEARSGSGPTELQIVVDRLSSVTAPAHQVWLPPLPPALALDHLLGVPADQDGRGFSARHWPHSGRLAVPLGLLDLPLRQEQETLVMDFAGAHGHLAAVGAPRTGRSTLLRTIMLAAMLTHTPEEIQFYCVDFGGGTLHPFAKAPHVGSVAGRNESELVSRTLAEIRTLITEREELLRELGLDSMADLRDRRRDGTLPDGIRSADVFLMIDNWGALRTEYENADPVLAEIAARGLGAGVHLVLTSGRWNDIRPALRDSIGTRIELRLNDPSESEINRRIAAAVPSNVAGRGLSAPGVFFQFVLPRIDGQDTADGLREAQHHVLGKITDGWTGRGAPAIRLLPHTIQVRELAADQESTAVPIGIAESNLETVSLDLTGDNPHFLVYGDSGSGKSTLLRTYLGGLVERTSPYDMRVILFDYRHALLDVVPEEHLGAYAGDATTAQVYVQQVCEKLQERLPPPGVSQAQLRSRDWWEGTELYLVIDDYDLVGGSGSSVLNPLAAFVPQAREIGLHIILARRVAGAARTLSDPLATRIRDMGTSGIVLSGDHREGVVLGDERAAQRPPGRGVLVERGSPGRLIQVAQPDTAEPAASA